MVKIKKALQIEILTDNIGRFLFFVLLMSCIVIVSGIRPLFAQGWIDDGTVVRLETSTDNVGIGTTTPEAKLEVVGELAIKNNDGSYTHFGYNDGGGNNYIRGNLTQFDTQVYFKGPNPWVDVRAYGAVGNGTTDDTTALQNAANAAVGGILFIPAGTYGVTSLVSISTKTVVYGAGIESTILKAITNFSGIGIIGASSGTTRTDILIQDLTLDGNSLLGTNSAPVNFAGTNTRITLQRVRIINASGASTWAINIDNGTDIRVEDCISDGSGAIRLPTSQIRPYITGCQVLSSGNGGIVVNAGSFGRIVGNTIRDMASGSSGIDVGGSSDMSIVGNTLTGTNAQILLEDAANISVSSNIIKNSLAIPETGGIVASNNATHLGSFSITGNIIDTTPLAAIELFIPTATLPFFVIADNVIRNSNRESIKVTGATSGVISNNILINGGQQVDNAYDAIDLISSSNVVVIGNRISDSVTNRSRCGIREATDSSGTVLIGNRISGVRSAPIILNSGTTGDFGTVLPNNLMALTYRNAADNGLVTVARVDSGNDVNIGEGAGTTRIFSTLTVGNGGTPISKHMANTITWDPPSLTNGSVAATTVTVTGASVGDIAYASHTQIGERNFIISAHVQAANTVRVVLRNVSGSTLDIASGTLRVNVWKY